MARKPETPSADSKLIRIAVDQVFTREAAIAAGVSRYVIDKRVDNGTLVRVARGVYRLAGSTLDGRTAERAALAVTSGVALGLWSANYAHGVTGGVRPAKVHVMVRRPCHLRATSWYVPHETRRIDDDEITTRERSKITTMPRTVRDFAAVLPHKEWADRQITKWIEEALILRKMQIHQLAAIVDFERAPQCRARLERLLEHQLGSDPQVFRSIGEEWLRDLVERRSLPMPKFNVRAAGGILAEADAYWELVPLIIEFDGFQFHHTRNKHVNDRRRDRRAWRHGIPTIRITPDDFKHDLAALEADIERFVLTPPLRKAA